MTLNGKKTKAATFDPSNGSQIVRALQFNVWLDATRVRGGLELVADKIIESRADIVSLCEVKNLLGDFVDKLKKELRSRGVTYYGNFAGNPRKFALDADTAIISRFPITEETIVYRTRENSIVRSMIDLEDGQSLAIYSVHLEYRAYTSYLPRGYCSNSELFPGWQMITEYSFYSGWNVFGVYFVGWLWALLCRMVYGSGKPTPITNVDLIRQDNISSKRPDAIARLVDDTRLLPEGNTAVIIMGDFNEPSTLDWTAETAQAADHNGVIYNWDSTELLRKNGFVDCYREAFPNPLTNPGFSWPVVARGTNGKPLNTGWLKKADERDRIDFVFYKGQGLKTLDAWLVGTPLSVVRDEFVDESELYQDRWSQQANSLWPSDHRAVMAVIEKRKT